MDKERLEDIFYQIRLLQEYEMAQRFVGDEAIQPPPSDELEKIVRRIERKE